MNSSERRLGSKKQHQLDEQDDLHLSETLVKPHLVLAATFFVSTKKIPQQLTISHIGGVA
jgi:hypothetical protein